MPTKKKSKSNWLKSKEVMKTLKVRACDITHMREAGKFEFTKDGNAFLYSEESVNQILASKGLTSLFFLEFMTLLT